MYSEDLMINEKTQTLHIISNGSIIAVKIKKVFILSFIYAVSCKLKIPRIAKWKSPVLQAGNPQNCKTAIESTTETKYPFSATKL